ncbi:hypothetical protein GSI_02120 [Ganoderma sinense ZZ0214-1]|uniref:Glycosyltransferase n=1 Tax=Ganoderma sinense ZZ0214-1 TaxID=1077348 RepID=A0A2G8SNP7_9APHY|nr:hypothetical protein GSI_02120 [Ganoderma sinense ZZ0214-1]
MAISAPAKRLTLVYYCSGHGYGHATRVSAFARHLLSLQSSPIIHIVSSAPKHVFSDSMAQGALYRNADIDPVIVQPLAYRVDRRKSVEVLESFLAKKDAKVADELQWLRAIHADCVLSDAAFLGCLAANEAGIPSVLITNFSFDSVYSYLSTSMIDESPRPVHPTVDAMLSPTSIKTKDELEPDTPIPEAELAPLVAQIHAGYRCADLLLRLPGTIPLPSFALHPALPSPAWINDDAHTFQPFVTAHLTQPPLSYKLHPQIPFPPQYPPKPLPREVRDAPLIVRPPSADIYTQEGRSRLLTAIGVPQHLHDPEQTKILVVSFGGQIFHKPASRSHSRTPSKAATPTAVPPVFAQSPSGTVTEPAPEPALSPSSSDLTGVASTEGHAQALADALRDASPRHVQPEDTDASASLTNGSCPRPRPKPPSRTPSLGARFSQLRVAGAPPVAVPASPRALTSGFLSSPSPAVPTFQAITIPPTPSLDDAFSRQLAPAPVPDSARKDEEEEGEGEGEVRILPSDAWIAIVCGVPQDWADSSDAEEGLPARFFVAPRDVYMPDLTAAADVLLGKLGYGTVAECVAARTPCVYVPRPLFVEEHGLRAFLEREGVGVRMGRERYEVGEWAGSVWEAYVRGREGKERMRRTGEGEEERGWREEEGREMARGLVEWVGRWQAGVAEAEADAEGASELKTSAERMNGNGVEGREGRLLN